MDNGIIVTAGLVLRETETKESDKILTVLTPELGRISVIAKGARSRRSKYTAACQLLAYDEMTLRRKGEWYYLAEAGTLELFDGVRQDIQRLALASYFAELTETVCQDALAAAEILPLLLNALFALGTLGKEPLVVKAAFVWRLLDQGAGAFPAEFSSGAALQHLLSHVHIVEPAECLLYTSSHQLPMPSVWSDVPGPWDAVPRTIVTVLPLSAEPVGE